MSELIQLTEKIWKEYYEGDREKLLRSLEWFAQDCVVVGAGRQELFRDLCQLRDAVVLKHGENQSSLFECTDFFGEELPLSGDFTLVYGGGAIWRTSEDGLRHSRVDSRFSFLYRRENGAWRITHIHHSSPSQLLEEDIFRAEVLGEQPQLVQEKMESLLYLAETDSLTGLMNYRSFCRKYPGVRKEGAWLVILDIDNFKGVNDRYGHLAGNETLQRLSRILVSSAHQGDLVCRMGGAEFILLCSLGMTREEALLIAQELQTALNREEEKPYLAVGVSIGMTQLEENESLESALERADSALYLSKVNGKGRASIL